MGYLRDDLALGMRYGAAMAALLQPVLEGDKLLNGKDGGLATPLAEGPHKLSLYISSKNYPKSAVKVFVLLPDGTLVKGPMLPAK